jgi:hypothetical protein
MTIERHRCEGQFEREGLLDGLEPDERKARLELLWQLVERGVGLDELRAAVAQDRLALLPIELLFKEDCQFTLREYAERSGLGEELLRRDFLALGLPVPDPDDPQFSERHIAAGRMLRDVIDAGVGEDRVLDMARTIGRAAAVTAQVILQTFGDAFLAAGETERDLGFRFADLASGLMPSVGPLLGNVVELHMREIVRQGVLDRAERTSGQLRWTAEVTIAFADMVGFTQLGAGDLDRGRGNRREALRGDGSRCCKTPRASDQGDRRRSDAGQR